MFACKSAFVPDSVPRQLGKFSSCSCCFCNYWYVCLSSSFNRQLCKSFGDPLHVYYIINMFIGSHVKTGDLHCFPIGAILICRAVLRSCQRQGRKDLDQCYYVLYLLSIYKLISISRCMNCNFCLEPPILFPTQRQAAYVAVELNA